MKTFVLLLLSFVSFAPRNSADDALAPDVVCTYTIPTTFQPAMTNLTCYVETLNLTSCDQTDCWLRLTSINSTRTSNVYTLTGRTVNATNDTSGNASDNVICTLRFGRPAANVSIAPLPVDAATMACDRDIKNNTITRVDSQTTTTRTNETIRNATTTTTTRNTAAVRLIKLAEEERVEENLPRTNTYWIGVVVVFVFAFVMGLWIVESLNTKGYQRIGLRSHDANQIPLLSMRSSRAM